MGYCIGICGDSGSGKTTLSKRISNHLTSCLILECDRYHKWERGNPNWQNFTHLNTESNHLDLMRSDVNKLIAGKSIVRGDYDHSNGKFTEPKQIDPFENLVVCGLHSLHCDDVYDLKIYMDTDDDLRTFWKISRDTKSRGHTFESVKKQIDHRRIDFKKYVEPQKDKADIIINFYSESSNKLDIAKGIGTKMKILVNKSLSEDLIYSSYAKESISVTVTNKGRYNEISFLSYPTSDVRYYYDYIMTLLKSMLLS